MIGELKCFKRNCTYFIGVTQPDGSERTERAVCKAFPDGIPDEIAYGSNPDTASYPGDRGIQYERARPRLTTPS